MLSFDSTILFTIINITILVLIVAVIVSLIRGIFGFFKNQNRLVETMEKISKNIESIDAKLSKDNNDINRGE